MSNTHPHIRMSAGHVEPTNEAPKFIADAAGLPDDVTREEAELEARAHYIAARGRYAHIQERSARIAELYAQGDTAAGDRLAKRNYRSRLALEDAMHEVQAILGTYGLASAREWWAAKELSEKQEAHDRYHNC